MVVWMWYICGFWALDPRVGNSCLLHSSFLYFYYSFLFHYSVDDRLRFGYPTIGGLGIELYT